MTIPPRTGAVSPDPNTHTIGPYSWGLQRGLLGILVLLVGLDQRQIGNQGQGPHLPRGCSQLADQKLGQQSCQADTTTMRAARMKHLQPQSESLFCATLERWKRGARVGMGRGKHDHGVTVVVPMRLLHPPSLVFPTHYSFLFFPPFFPLLSSTFCLFPSLEWLGCSCLDNFLLLLPGKEGTEIGWAPGWPGPKEGRLGCYL